MAKEHWYFLMGALAVVLPLCALYVVKKTGLLESGPDQAIAYKTVNNRVLSLHAWFAPDRPSGEPAPALLLFHGGRWLYGGPNDFAHQCRWFASQGISCFSAQYRLGARNIPEVLRALEDAQDALAYLHTHAAALNIDSGRIAAGGGSSGGHLAAALGTAVTALPAERARPAALVLYNPMLDLSPGTPDHHLVRDFWQSVSPLQHVDAATPPTLVLVGSEDPEVPVTTVEAFCAAVSKHGGQCEAAVYPGQSHGFFNYWPDNTRYFDETNQRVLKFLQGIWQ